MSQIVDLFEAFKDALHQQSELNQKRTQEQTRAERIRSYMDDSGMSRKEATAMVDFEDGK